MREEMGLKVLRERFEYKNLLYPINPVVFEHPKMLGYFDPHAYQIGINKKLLGKASHKFVKDILRHELCHLYLHINGHTGKSHGPEFRQQCLAFNWNEEIYAATTDIGAEKLVEGVSGEVEAKILQKVKKLLSLSESSNPHEAQLATAKANQLILEHNLEILENDFNQDEEAYLLRVLGSKKNNQKLKSIYEILKLFMVQPVFSYSQGHVFLEVIGERIHVEMADYVAKFLDNEMERLWKMAKKENLNLKGTRSKNSFFAGLANGFCNSINLERESQKITSKELISLNKQLQKKVDLVYSRLASTSSSAPGRCSQSMSLGHQAGSRMNIRKGLGQGIGRRLLGL